MYLLMGYIMYLCVSYEGSKWGVQTAPPAIVVVTR